ncbi:PREDICTED: uncharacterized protein LOC109188126 [Ipomoea nil]|uniref:uncharacterized protein LOC109188126 n=1 Tax=Ipomoea nil TaxID=35883 RepID=UPI0009019B5A|nr:PREDICTED: uncharacterized protein LOC109188126 [Ipomoea nil]
MAVLSSSGFLITILAISLFLAPHGRALKLPLRPTDIAPLLPQQQLPWSIINSLDNAADRLPSFVGAANRRTVEWRGSCFRRNSAWLELYNNSKSAFGGGTLHIKVSKARSWTCLDVYVFATPYRVKWDYFFFSRHHKVKIGEWASEAELEYVKNTGVSIFLMSNKMLVPFNKLFEVFPLFANTGWDEKANIKFLKKRMKARFEERSNPWVARVSTDDIHSGDFLAISKFRGHWSGFETFEKWVTGSFAGHTAVCLRDPKGELWVAETGHVNGKGEHVIALIPWDEWWEFKLRKDDSDPHIALLPLRADLRAKFNETAAWEYATSMDGERYGYHNIIFSWIDTIDQNYPKHLDANLIACAMTIWNQVQPAYAANMCNEALNKRLGTKGLDLPEILVEVERRGSSFAELLTIPERDDWVYADGKSTSCVAFVLQIYKEAGLFGPLASSIQVTEFTIKDAYSLKIFEDDTRRLPLWCSEGDAEELPFCQLRGKYKMELPHYNTIEPYAHMNERCPSRPPKYSRPERC